MGKELTLRPVAHRGMHEKAPENTMAAFQAAAEAGCCIETDIRMSADGEVMIFHDENFLRLCRGLDGIPDGPMETFTREEISRIRLPYGGHVTGNFFPENGYQSEEWYNYPWPLDQEKAILARAAAYGEMTPAQRINRLLADYDSAYRAACEADPRWEPVPTLEEFLRWVALQPDGFFAEIEFKGLGMSRKVFDLIEKTGTASKCILMSGDLAHVREMQETAARDGKPAGLRFGVNIRWCDEAHLSLLEGYDLWELGLNAGAFDATDVARLADRGVVVFANLGDTPDWWETLIQTGAVAFKTNTPSRYLEWYHRRG